MNAVAYISVLEAGLKPFLSSAINVTESPNLNPIENVWHELKEYIRCVVKAELISGILEFWETVDVDKCRKYIGHLKKVVPKVIELNGGPTGY